MEDTGANNCNSLCIAPYIGGNIPGVWWIIKHINHEVLKVEIIYIVCCMDPQLTTHHGNDLGMTVWFKQPITFTTWCVVITCIMGDNSMEHTGANMDTGGGTKVTL